MSVGKGIIGREVHFTVGGRSSMLNANQVRDLIVNINEAVACGASLHGELARDARESAAEIAAMEFNPKTKVKYLGADPSPIQRPKPWWHLTLW